jgi:hypothetical protein
MVSMVAKEEIGAMERVKSDEEVLLGAAGEEEDEDVMLPGYRFHPTDEELVTFYLRRKVARKSLRIEVIREMDIYKHDPWDLPSKSSVHASLLILFLVTHHHFTSFDAQINGLKYNFLSGTRLLFN